MATSPSGSTSAGNYAGDSSNSSVFADVLKYQEMYQTEVVGKGAGSSAYKLTGKGDG